MQDALPHLFDAAPSLMYQLVTMLSPKYAPFSLPACCIETWSAAPVVASISDCGKLWRLNASQPPVLWLL